jgi:hypothetical protein
LSTQVNWYCAVVPSSLWHECCVGIENWSCSDMAVRCALTTPVVNVVECSDAKMRFASCATVTVNFSPERSRVPALEYTPSNSSPGKSSQRSNVRRAHRSSGTNTG